MEKIINLSKQKTNISKLINILILGIISFFMASTSNAFLFNPFIIATLYLVLSFSPYYYLFYALPLGFFSMMISLNYGVEIFLVSSFLIFIDLIIKFINLPISYDRYIPLIFLLIILSLRYGYENFSLASIFTILINVIFSLVLSFSFEKVKNSYQNKFERLNKIYQIIAFSSVYVLFLNVDIFNMFLISTTTLIFIKHQEKEVVLSQLFLLFLYNYLFFNVSFDLLLIYLISLTISMINLKFSSLIFILVASVLQIVKNPLFYQDISFYLVFASGLFVYFLPSSLEKKIKLLNFNQEERTAVLEEEMVNLKDRFNNATSYLSLLKKNPIDEIPIEDNLIENVKSTLCDHCQNYQYCLLRDRFENYLKKSISKEEKIKILNECLYPYKLIKRFENSNKTYYSMLNQVEEKKLNRSLFTQQIESVLNILSEDGEEKEKEKQFEISYEAITSSFSSQNGDSYTFIDKNNHTMMLLSDGMGHSLKSHQLSKYLIDLFTSSCFLNQKVDKTIKNLNLILKNKAIDEMFATLDLADFNLADGNLTLYKAGSFSSFLIRDNNCIQYNLISPPLGIINNLNLVKEEIKLQDNDIFIFLTDGFKDEVNDIITRSTNYLNTMNFNLFIKTLFKELNVDQVKDDKTLIVCKVHAR